MELFYLLDLCYCLNNKNWSVSFYYEDQDVGKVDNIKMDFGEMG
jgi:hypothetical protein